MNTTPFIFSITDALREAWTLLKKHIGFFAGIALVTVLLKLVDEMEHIPLIVSILIAIASLVWSIVWIKISLAAARGQESRLTFQSLQSMLPTLREALMFIGVAILTGLCIIAGLVLLIIPGIYIMLRLTFSTMAYLDRKEGIKKSLRFSWDITKGKLGKIILVSLVCLLLIIVGLALVGVGVLVTYPLAGILIAKLYLALVAHSTNAEAVIVQPVEIPAELSPVEPA